MKIIPLSLALLAILCLGASAKTVTASSGSSSAVQSAIDSATDGDTVMIPSGTFGWANGITVKKAIKLLGTGETTVLQATGSATLVTLTPSAKGNVEFGKVKFTRSANGNGSPFVYALDAPGKPMLMHDIRFEGRQPGNRCVEWGVNGGVIYNCTFIAMDKADSNGIGFKNPSSDSAWHEPDYMGMADVNGDKNTYLEDCTFKDLFLQCIDFDDNSRSVMRHCVFDNSAIGSHGQETSSVGARQWECYKNEFIFTPGVSNPTPQQYPLNMNYFIFIRGGGPGVFFDNKVPDITSQAWGNKVEVKFNLYNIRRFGQVPCQTQHPAAHQIGWGISASGDFVLDPVYFWGNTGGGNYNNPTLEDYNPDDCGNNLHTADFVQKNREFYVETPKPFYTPYTYPHPLRGVTGVPTPTPEPSATPEPTATAEPSATPTPAPTATATPIPTPPMLPPGTYRIPEGSTITVP